MLYFSETTLFLVQSSSIKESLISIFASAHSLLCCSEIDWWLVLFIWACSLICYSNYCLSWWFFLLLMNSCFIVNFDLRKREEFQFSIFILQRSYLWSYWVEWELILIIRLCFLTCWSIWYIIRFNRLLLSHVSWEFTLYFNSDHDYINVDDQMLIEFLAQVSICKVTR